MNVAVTIPVHLLEIRAVESIITPTWLSQTQIWKGVPSCEVIKNTFASHNLFAQYTKQLTGYFQGSGIFYSSV